jgi:hypothetical protein
VVNKLAKIGELVASSRCVKSPAILALDSLNQFHDSTPVELKVSGDQQIIQPCLPFTLPALVSVFSCLLLSKFYFYCFAKVFNISKIFYSG